MSRWIKRYSAPIIVLIIILSLWQGLVTLLEIEQFLLPKPTAILSNLFKVVVLAPGTESLDQDQAEALVKNSDLFVKLPNQAHPETVKDVLANKIFQFSLFGYTVALTRGPNL